MIDSLEGKNGATNDNSPIIAQKDAKTNTSPLGPDKHAINIYLERMLSMVYPPPSPLNLRLMSVKSASAVRLFTILVHLIGCPVFSWGRGEDGQLGLGDTNDQDRPILVDALKCKGVVQVACGSGHTVVLSGECIYYNNIYFFSFSSELPASGEEWSWK